MLNLERLDGWFEYCNMPCNAGTSHTSNLGAYSGSIDAYSGSIDAFGAKLYTINSLYCMSLPVR